MNYCYFECGIPHWDSVLITEPCSNIFIVLPMLNKIYGFLIIISHVWLTNLRHLSRHYKEKNTRSK